MQPETLAQLNTSSPARRWVDNTPNCTQPVRLTSSDLAHALARLSAPAAIFARVKSAGQSAQLPELERLVILRVVDDKRCAGWRVGHLRALVQIALAKCLLDRRVPAHQIANRLELGKSQAHYWIPKMRQEEGKGDTHKPSPIKGANKKLSIRRS